MKKFTIVRLEIHRVPVEIEADNMKEALKLALDGEGAEFDNPHAVIGSSYVETADDYGKPISELDELGLTSEEITEIEYQVRQHFLPGICDIFESK